MSHNILSRYVKKNAFFAIVAAICGLWLLQVLFSYLSELENLSDTYTFKDALWYIIYKSPYFLEQFISTGALLGAVVGLGLLANNSELVVMRASGVSIFRIVSWVLQPALLFVIFALAINQFVLPTSNHLADRAHAGNVNKEEKILSVNGYWTVQKQYQSKNDNLNNSINGQKILYIDYADINGDIGLVKQWSLDNQGNIKKVVVSNGGSYLRKDEMSTDGITVKYQWQLNDLREVSIDNKLEINQNKESAHILDLPIKPEFVYLLTRDSEDLSLTQLYAHRGFMRSQGNRSLDHELAFWQKLLSPLSILSLVIVACSFVFGSLRTHSLGLRVVIALLFGLFFSYMQDLVGFISLATGWSPFLMVILPILSSALVGIWLLSLKK